MFLPRRCLLLTIPLFVGAAISIATAWFIAFHEWEPGTQDPSLAWPDSAPNAYIVSYGSRGTGWTVLAYSSVTAAAVTDHDIKFYPGGLSSELPTTPLAHTPRPSNAIFVPGSNSVLISSYGLPFRCLQCSEWESFSGCFVSQIADHGALNLGRFHYKPLPIAPLWRGLLADTALFSLPFYAAALLIGPVRTRLRRRRNLCPACAYNRQGLQSNSPCPECGHSLA